jgi:hypothetical protein
MEIERVYYFKMDFALWDKLLQHLVFHQEVNLFLLLVEYY